LHALFVFLCHCEHRHILSLPTRRSSDLDGAVSYTIDINIPDLDDPQPDKQVSAVVQAANTGTMPPDLVLRLLLNALQVPDIDGRSEEHTSELQSRGNLVCCHRLEKKKHQ